MSEIDRGASKSRGRKEPKLLKIVMVTLIVAILFVASLSLLPGPSSDTPSAPIPTRISYTTHNPISINGNAQFNNTNFPNNGVVSGNGTVLNPYVISGWDINAASGEGIWIRNTDAYFIVRDCYVHGGTGWHLGIYLNNCVNGKLSDNACSNNMYGIYLYSAGGNTLSDNNLSSNVYYGIYLDLISVSLSSNTLSNNTCNSNGRYGIYLLRSDNYNIVSNNTCNSNGQYGISIDWTSNNIVSNNTISNNTGYGVYVWNAASQNNRIWNNTFYHNNGSGDTYNQAKNQALDSGGINWWNSTDGYGNYWADWTTPDVVERFGIVDLPYNITGTRGAKDYYPLTSPEVIAPPIPEFSEFIVPIVGLMLIALIFGRTRKEA